MSKRKQFKIGNQVAVRKGGTIFEITDIAPDGHRCMIREIGMAPNGKRYREQPFDTSLLHHAVTNEMLRAFSAFGLTAKRKGD